MNPFQKMSQKLDAGWKMTDMTCEKCRFTILMEPSTLKGHCVKCGEQFDGLFEDVSVEKEQPKSQVPPKEFKKELPKQQETLKESKKKNKENKEIKNKAKKEEEEVSESSEDQKKPVGKHNNGKFNKIIVREN